MLCSSVRFRVTPVDLHVPCSYIVVNTTQLASHKYAGAEPKFLPPSGTARQAPLLQSSTNDIVQYGDRGYTTGIVGDTQHAEPDQSFVRRLPGTSVDSRLAQVRSQ